MKTLRDLSPQRAVVSIVSHGHMPMVQRLLQQLAQHCDSSIARVVVTHNIAEALLLPPEAGWPFAVQEVFNHAPLGFGPNHNRALSEASEAFVCVLNPDVELLAQEGDLVAQLIAAAEQPAVGCSYPIQVNDQGEVQRSERELPTPAALWRRRALHIEERRVDWVNAACVLMPTAAWQHLHGFDEAYFMYCEDVDFSLRMQLQGWQLCKVPVRIRHAGQHASHRNWRHLAWHIRSLVRLWMSAPYRQTLQRLRTTTGTTSR